uniref:Uncharacterized protein n=1 Tax=Arundo donax TaxID=35708 RepID=A0A0A9BQ10_ARUDO
MLYCGLRAYVCEAGSKGRRQRGTRCCYYSVEEHVAIVAAVQPSKWEEKAAGREEEEGEEKGEKPGSCKIQSLAILDLHIKGTK